MQVGFAKAANEAIHVAKMYSVRRVTTMAGKMRLRPGWALDLCTQDEQGNHSDLTQVSMRNKAARKVIQDQPLVIIGNPPCIDWATIMNLNWDRMDPAKVEESKRIANIHLDFRPKLHGLQHSAGRYVLHEHPNSASSWHQAVIT